MLVMRFLIAALALNAAATELTWHASRGNVPDYLARAFGMATTVSLVCATRALWAFHREKLQAR